MLYPVRELASDKMPYRRPKLVHLSMSQILDSDQSGDVPMTREELEEVVASTICCHTRMSPAVEWEIGVVMGAIDKHVALRLAEVQASRATPHELELRQRHAWVLAGCCPKCGTYGTDGRLCFTCYDTVRFLNGRERKQWRRFEPHRTEPPIQGHGYSPAGLLGCAPEGDA